MRPTVQNLNSNDQLLSVVRAEDNQPDDAVHTQADSLLAEGRQHQRHAKQGGRPAATATTAPGHGGHRPVLVRVGSHGANTGQEAQDRP